MANPNSNIDRSKGGGGGGGGATTIISEIPTLLHSPAIDTPVPLLSGTPDEVRGNVGLNPSDPDSVIAAGSTLRLTLPGSVDVDVTFPDPIASVNGLVSTIQTAIDTVYQGLGVDNPWLVSLPYVNSVFYIGLRRYDAVIGVLQGTLAVALGLGAGNVASVTTLEAQSPNLMLPIGSYKFWQFRMLGTTYSTQSWYTTGSIWKLEDDSLISEYLAFQNRSGWYTNLFTTDIVESIQIGVARAYSVEYFNILFNPSTGEFSWAVPAGRVLPSAISWHPSITSLTVVAR